MITKQRGDSSRGVILPLLALGIVALLSLFSITLSRGYRGVSKAELQAAVDAAAHAGAKEICSEQRCFDAARAVTLAKLGKQRLYRGLGASQNLMLEATAAQAGPSPDVGPLWTDGSTYDVEIIRGAWWPEGTPNSEGAQSLPNENRFQRLEDYRGSPLGSPFGSGVPSFLVANAIYVRVTLKGIKDPLTLVSGTESVTAWAIAISGRIGFKDVSPFAIPACALVADNTGTFSPAARCEYDIYFTRADRYCASDPTGECGVIPEFPAKPSRMAGFNESNSCFFARESLPSHDVFGFVAAPAGTTEEEIAAGRTFELQIGDSLTVFKDGLTQPATQDLIEERMRDPDNSQAGDLYGLGYNSFDVASKAANSLCGGTPQGSGLCNMPHFSYEPNNWLTHDDNGICGGMTAFVPHAQYEFRSDRWIGNYSPDTLQETLEIEVPVVAWAGMGECKGVNGATLEPPPPPPGTQVKVLGFLKAYIYGVDIGRPPPIAPQSITRHGDCQWRGSREMEDYEDYRCEYSDNFAECYEMIWERCEGDCWREHRTEEEEGGGESEENPDVEEENASATQSSYRLRGGGPTFLRANNPNVPPEVTPYDRCIQRCAEERAQNFQPYRDWQARRAECLGSHSFSCMSGGENLIEKNYAPWRFSPGGVVTNCNLVRARTSCAENYIPSVQNMGIRDITIVR